MAKGRGIPLCLGCLFSCCALTTAVLIGLALVLRFAENPLIDSQVKQVSTSVHVGQSTRALFQAHKSISYRVFALNLNMHVK